MRRTLLALTFLATLIPAPASADTPDCGGVGPRFQIVYARPAAWPDRLETLRPRILAGLAEIEARFEANGRHLRVVSDPATCEPEILALALSAGTVATEAARTAGLTRADRKYALFREDGFACASEIAIDDRHGPENRNNAGPTVSYLAPWCWSDPHEFLHALGAVQPSAPHAVPGLHCGDAEHAGDLMCYPPAARAPGFAPCPLGPARFDCGGDDYWSPDPPAGSYLATHWNAYNSAFLSGRPTFAAPAPRLFLPSFHR